MAMAMSDLDIMELVAPMAISDLGYLIAANRYDNASEQWECFRHQVPGVDKATFLEVSERLLLKCPGLLLKTADGQVVDTNVFLCLPMHAGCTLCGTALHARGKPWASRFLTLSHGIVNGSVQFHVCENWPSEGFQPQLHGGHNIHVGLLVIHAVRGCIADHW